MSCVGSGRFARSRCTSCSTTPTCATAWTRFRDNIHDYGQATTAAATPAELADAYRQALADSGGDGVVAVHLSAALSGTIGAAETTAAEIGSAVRVLDSKVGGDEYRFHRAGRRPGSRRRRGPGHRRGSRRCRGQPQSRVHRRTPAGQPAAKRAHRWCRRLAGHQAVTQAAAAHRRRQTRSGATGTHRQQGGRDDDRPGVRCRRGAVRPRSRCITSPTPTAQTTWPPRWPSGCPRVQPAIVTDLGPVLAYMSAPARSRCAWN